MLHEIVYGKFLTHFEKALFLESVSQNVIYSQDIWHLYLWSKYVLANKSKISLFFAGLERAH